MLHIVPGLLFMILGPLQFSTTIRARHLQWHRWNGRVVLGCGLVIGASALIMLIGGDIGSGAEDILVQGSALLSLSYSRSAETGADRHSVELMHKAGRDPRAIGHFLELIRDKLGDKEERDFLSTHPATPERVKNALVR